VDVVVHDRLRQRLDQPALDLEARRRGYVLEMDPAERWRDPDHRLHEPVDVVGRHVDQDRHR
jgi:hypothetical protein